MIKSIVLEGHTLGVVFPNGLQVLKASVKRGGGHNIGVSMLYFDPILQAGTFREATEQDFQDFGVCFHPDYLTEYMDTAKAPKIIKNRFDNWNGYLGNKKVIEFGNSREFTAEQHAQQWLKEKQEEQGLN